MYKRLFNSLKIFIISFATSVIFLNVKVLGFFMKKMVHVCSQPPYLTLTDKLVKSLSESKLDPVHTDNDYHNHPVLARLKTEVDKRTKLLKEEGSVGLIRAVGRSKPYDDKLSEELVKLNKDPSAAVISQRFADNHKANSFLEALDVPEKMNSLITEIKNAGGPKKYMELQKQNDKEDKLIYEIRSDVDKSESNIENLFEEAKAKLAEFNKKWLVPEIEIEVDDSDFYPPLKPHLTGDAGFYDNREAVSNVEKELKLPVKKKTVTKKKIIKNKTIKKPVKKSSKNKKR